LTLTAGYVFCTVMSRQSLEELGISYEQLQRTNTHFDQNNDRSSSSLSGKTSKWKKTVDKYLKNIHQALSFPHLLSCPVVDISLSFNQIYNSVSITAQVSTLNLNSLSEKELQIIIERLQFYKLVNIDTKTSLLSHIDIIGKIFMSSLCASSLVIFVNCLRKEK
jgi:hypothetical protein